MLKKHGRDREILFIVLIIILFVTIILNTSLFNKLFGIVEIREIEGVIIVSDKIGFDLNSTILTFGEVLPGGSSSRFVGLKNNFAFPIQVEVYGRGEIKNFIIPFGEKIERGEKKDIKVSAFAPLNAEFGRYEGKVVFKIRKI